VFHNEGVKGKDRKQWAKPLVRRLSAGAAETGERFNEDGNSDTFNSRS
jgi:hypothetical protein